MGLKKLEERYNAAEAKDRSNDVDLYLELECLKHCDEFTKEERSKSVDKIMKCLEIRDECNQMKTRYFIDKTVYCCTTSGLITGLAIGEFLRNCVPLIAEKIVKK